MTASAELGALPRDLFVVGLGIANQQLGMIVGMTQVIATNAAGGSRSAPLWRSRRRIAARRSSSSASSFSRANRTVVHKRA